MIAGFNESLLVWVSGREICIEFSVVISEHLIGKLVSDMVDTDVYNMWKAHNLLVFGIEGDISGFQESLEMFKKLCIDRGIIECPVTNLESCQNIQ